MTALDEQVDLTIRLSRSLAEALYGKSTIGDVITLMAHHHSGSVPLSDAEARFTAAALTELTRKLGPVAQMTLEQANDLLTDGAMWGQCDLCSLPYWLAGDDYTNPETGCHYECEAEA